MLGTPRYIQNIFNVVFPRQLLIRRLANQFEDALQENYAQPQIISIPDELDFQIPRIVFESTHGYSRILISQVSISLNVTYSIDWQNNIALGKEYLLARVPIIYNLIEELLKVKPLFGGLTTLVRIHNMNQEDESFSRLSKHFLKEPDIIDAHDIQIKLTRVLSKEFFSNITIQNYRVQKSEGMQQDIAPAPRREVLETGIQISGDYNDRYAYNEKGDYHSTKDKSIEIIDGGLQIISETIKQIAEG